MTGLAVLFGLVCIGNVILHHSPAVPVQQIAQEQAKE
jgi:hypothetical protein